MHNICKSDSCLAYLIYWFLDNEQNIYDSSIPNCLSHDDSQGSMLKTSRKILVIGIIIIDIWILLLYSSTSSKLKKAQQRSI